MSKHQLTGVGRAAVMAAARKIVAEAAPEVLISFNGGYQDVSVISTGAFMLDSALGVGGFPRGRLIELFGPPSSGKSTTAMEAAKNAQQDGLSVLYVDFEHSFDKPYADVIGLDTGEDGFALLQPDTLEQGMKLVEQYLELGAVGLIIIDSLAAMVTEKELEGEIGDGKYFANQARAMSQVLRRLTGKISKADAAVIFINHERDVIDTHARPGMPIRKTTPGGVALKFYASVRVQLQQVESIKGKTTDTLSGNLVDGSVAVKIRATVVKNKLGPPYRTGFFYLRPEKGIWEEKAVLEFCIARGIIKQNGSRYLLPFNNGKGAKVNVGGQEAVFAYFASHESGYQRLRDKVLELLGKRPEDTVHPVVQESEVDPETATDEELEAAIDEAEVIVKTDGGSYSMPLSVKKEDSDEEERELVEVEQ